MYVSYLFSHSTPAREGSLEGSTEEDKREGERGRGREGARQKKGVKETLIDTQRERGRNHSGECISKSTVERFFTFKSVNSPSY